MKEKSFLMARLRNLCNLLKSEFAFRKNSLHLLYAEAKKDLFFKNICAFYDVLGSYKNYHERTLKSKNCTFFMAM